MIGLYKKSAGSVLIARPAAKGLRIARNSRTSNAEPTPYDYTPKSLDPDGGVSLGVSIHTHIDIYYCFILDYFLRGCEVLSSQEKSAK